jgi:hypothetical protein
MNDDEGPTTRIAPAKAKKSREPAIDRDVRENILRAIRGNKTRNNVVEKSNYEQYIRDNEEKVLQIVKNKVGFLYSVKKIRNALKKALEEEHQHAAELEAKKAALKQVKESQKKEKKQVDNYESSLVKCIDDIKPLLNLRSIYKSDDILLAQQHYIKALHLIHSRNSNVNRGSQSQITSIFSKLSHIESVLLPGLDVKLPDLVPSWKAEVVKELSAEVAIASKGKTKAGSPEVSKNMKRKRTPEGVKRKTKSIKDHVHSATIKMKFALEIQENKQSQGGNNVSTENIKYTGSASLNSTTDVELQSLLDDNATSVCDILKEQKRRKIDGSENRNNALETLEGSFLYISSVPTLKSKYQVSQSKNISDNAMSIIQTLIRADQGYEPNPICKSKYKRY